MAEVLEREKKTEETAQPAFQVVIGGGARSPKTPPAGDSEAADDVSEAGLKRSAAGSKAADKAAGNHGDPAGSNAASQSTPAVDEMSETVQLSVYDSVLSAASKPIAAAETYFFGLDVRPKDGYFIRDLEHDLVLCPAGNLMRRKCSKSNGYARYMCKAACRKCRDFRRCYSGKKKWKEIDFPEGAVLVRCRNWNR